MKLSCSGIFSTAALVHQSENHSLQSLSSFSSLSYLKFILKPVEVSTPETNPRGTSLTESGAYTTMWSRDIFFDLRGFFLN